SGTPGPAVYELRHASPALATAGLNSAPRVIPEIWLADCESPREPGESSLLHPPAAASQPPVRATLLATDTVLLPSSVPLYAARQQKPRPIVVALLRCSLWT